MKQQQQLRRAWPKGRQSVLSLVVASVWCVAMVAVAAAYEAAGENMAKVVVQGVVYCEAPSQHHELLKDAEVQVECTNRGRNPIKKVGKTNAQGTFRITLQDYDFKAWGSNGCQAKLIASMGSKPAASACSTPTNMGGGLTGTNLVLKEHSNDRVVLTAGPFAFKPAAAENNLQNSKKVAATKDSSGSQLWYHDTSPPPFHYESPPYHKPREHEHEHKHEHEHHKKPRHKAHGEKDCHKSPPHREYKSPRHDSSPYYYKSPPAVPYYHKFPPPSHHKFPPPYYHESPPPYHHTSPPVYMSPPYLPYVHHVPPSPPHEVYKSPPPPPHDSYEAPPPPYYQKTGGSNEGNSVKAAPAESKGNSP